MSVITTRHNAALLLTMENGPVNALSATNGHVRSLIEAFAAAFEDVSCRVIVVAGAGKFFCGGADIAEFDAGETADDLRELVETIENSSKPVIMAIHGLALGGGLELALAGHYRIVQAGTRLGLPEVSLGLLPGAGGTQRLPRLIGAAAALDMMLSGKPITVEKARMLGLVDLVIDGDVVQAALELSASGDLLTPRTGQLPPPADLAGAIAVRRAALRLGLNQAPAVIIDCVEALSDDLKSGLTFEAHAFGLLLNSEPSRGLRHAFLGERQVARIPGLPKDLALRPITSAGVIGGGTMGTGIAITLLNAGLHVTMIEMRDEALIKAHNTIAKTLERDAEKGRISQEDATARLKRFTAAASYEALAQVDLVIEAVFEDLSVKQQVFQSAQAVISPHAILASNTSTLDLNLIADGVADPSRLVGLHFFSPANIMRLLEVVRANRTAPDVLATAMALGKRLGKVSVASGVCDGFIGNRMFEEYLRQVWFLLEEGALPQQIDAALERWGFAMGPCRTMDLVGQDIGWAIRKRRAVEQPDRPYSAIIDRICEMGRFGQKTGRGIYAYADARTPSPDPEIEQMIIAYSQEIGLTRRVIEDSEIVERCLLALINEGAHIVGEGIAYRPVDVDMVFLHGYGFARERGGPLFQADLIGAKQLAARIKALATQRNGWAWSVAPLIEKLAAEGGSFATLNA